MKKILLIVGAIITLIAIPVTIFVVKQQQELRGKAAPATSLSFVPATITAHTGDTFNIEVKIDTGENQVFVAELHIAYDPTKLEAQSIVNGPLFPNILISGAVDPTGKASITLGAANQTTPVIGIGTAAVVTFKALAQTTSPITVQFVSPDTFVGAKQEGATNVLIGTVPAKVTITDTSNTAVNLAAAASVSPTPTPTLPAGGSPTPTSIYAGGTNPTSTPPAGGSPTPTPTPSSLTIVQPNGTGNLFNLMPTIAGTGPSNTVITITFHQSGQTVTVQSDASGNWAYTPTQALSVGPHNITVSSPGGSGVLTATKSFVIAQDTISSSGSATPVSGSNMPMVMAVCIGFICIAAGIFLPKIYQS